MENFTAKIGAKIRDFQNKMKQVDKKVRETAMETSKPINADINEFYTQMALADAQAKQVLRRGTKEIDADASDFMRKAAQVAVVSRTLSQRIIIPVEARINKFQASIARIAQNTRAFGELGQTTIQGLALTFSSVLVPVIASTAGLIGQLGPLLGTVAGSTFALGSAFVTAGIGAGAFGAIAVTNLKDIFGAASDLKKLREKMAKTDDLEERNKIMEQMKVIQGSLTDEQLKALGAMDKLKDTWSGIAKKLESKTIDIFTQSLGVFGGVLTTLEPMFVSVTDAAKRLTDSFGAAINSEPMQAFFEYLNTTAGPMFETMTKGMGNFGLGILNLITAFSPLTKTTSDSFLSMSESFANWTAGLSGNKKFNNFVDYVKENMPKISSIFGDAFQGIINVFAAFAPSSADMMTGLQDMMERFREWSAQLGESQGFKNFINYITENGPKVVDAIGNITTFLIELGKALAPMGAYLLDVVNSVISWTNEMMKNHPWLGKILAAVVVITGALIAIAPNIIAFGALFGGAAKGVMAATSLMRAKFVTGMAMMVTSMVKTATAMVVNTAKMVAQWVIMGTKSTIQATKVAAAWVLATGKAMATAVASMVVAAAKMVGRWAFMGAQALIQAGRMAAAWFIALGPVGWVIAAIVGLAILIIANWDKIKAKTIEIWNKVSASVKEAAVKMVAFLVEGTAKMIGKISEFVGKVLAFRSKMLSAGKDLIQGLIDGAISMASNAVSSIKQVAGDMVDAALSFFKIKSPSRVFMSMGEFISKGLAVGVKDKARLAVASVSNMASAMTNAFTPNLLTPSMAGIQMTPLDTQSQMDSLHRQIKQELSVDMDVNHKGQGGNGRSTQAPVMYVTIDAKNVREINDVVRLFDQQHWDSE